jgi:hypothetical protein
MQLLPYSYSYQEQQDAAQFRFNSIGLHGEMPVIVSILPLQIGDTSYQLLDITLQCADRQWYGMHSLSNNGDREKILITICHIIRSYLRFYPLRSIFLMGHTVARTKLYQHGLIDPLLASTSLLAVHGFTGSNWEVYQPKSIYHAFIITCSTNDSQPAHQPFTKEKETPLR